MGTTTKPTKPPEDASRGVLFDGASISQLGQLFKMDRRTVQSKLGTGLQPVGRRDGHPIYAIYDAAPLLVEHDISLDNVEAIAAYIQKLDPTRLPRMLTKEFWAAMINKQNYEAKAEHLWPTEKVVEVFGDLVKSIRMPLVLAMDTVSASSELNPRQRQVLTTMIDSLLNDLHKASTTKLTLSKGAALIVEDDDEL